MGDGTPARGARAYGWNTTSTSIYIITEHTTTLERKRTLKLNNDIEKEEERERVRKRERKELERLIYC